MQRGIDSFFKKIPSSGTAKKTDDDAFKPAQTKRKARAIVSSDEDEIPESPQVNKTKKSRTAADTSPPSAKAKKPSLSKLKPSPKKELKRVNPASLFGGDMVRVEAKKAPKPQDDAVIELDDDDVNQSLMEIDVDESVRAAGKKALNGKHEDLKKESPSKDDQAKTTSADEGISTDEAKIPSSSATEKASTAEKKTSSEKVGSSSADKKKLSPVEKCSDSKKPLSKLEQKQQLKAEKLTPPADKKPKLEDLWKQEDAEGTPKSNTPKAKKEKSTPRARKEHADLESSVLSDEERHERKRASSMLYQKFKNRQSVINPGSKEVPKGKANCLAGLTFLVTGVLESLERDETASIIKEYGGKMMTVVGKRLNYLIVGEEAGPKKLAQAEDFNVPILSEDGFFDLIRAKSGQPTKGVKEEKNDVVVEKEQQKEAPTTSAKQHKENGTAPNVKIKKEKLHDSDVEVAVKTETLTSKKVKAEPLEQNNNSAFKKETALEQIERPKVEISADMLTWVDKYKPTSVNDIIGQQGAASNVAKLTNWLTKWYTNNDGKKKLSKPNPWAKNDDGSAYKAALLSGPPGIGKTTTATLVCKELGFDAVEFNASDTRSKRLLQEEVSELLSNKSLYGYFHGKAQAVTKKHVLIMDEVDGMAGNEDRGGIQELIGLIKDSSVPIICMCNDRNHQKMRSLVNYCYDLRFNKPRLEQIKGRMMSICFKEKVKLSPAKIEELIAATNNDIRQTINHISLLSAGKELNLKSDEAKSSEKVAQKDMKMGPWEVVRKVFSAEEHKRMTFYDKSYLFFHDYSMAPLFVQQNYLQVSPAGPKSEVLQKIALTADALSLGDLVDKRIRSSSAWSLLPVQAAFSSVMPGTYMSGNFTGQINFPGWLGKYSRTNKRNRLAQEIHDHTRLRTSGSRLSIRMDYAPFLLANIVRPLTELGMDGVEPALAVLKEYHLLREDLDGLIDLTTWPGKKGPMDGVDGRVKAALTRAYNKEVMAYTYSAAAGVKKKRADAAADAESELLAGGEGEEGGETAVSNVDSDAEKDDDNLENDGLIKAKKKTAASTSKAATSKAATSKKTTASKAKPAATKSKAK